MNTNTTSHKLANCGKFGLHVCPTPSGLWHYVGSVPENLMVTKKGMFGEYKTSMLFSTKELAIAKFNELYPTGIPASN
jgi:hypothetical protein